MSSISAARMSLVPRRWVSLIGISVPQRAQLQLPLLFFSIYAPCLGSFSAIWPGTSVATSRWRIEWVRTNSIPFEL